MGKEKTVALEHVKKATAKAKGKKTSRGGSSSRSAMPRGWIQGDSIRSTIRQDDIDELAEGGLIRHESAQLPEDETEPRPQEEEVDEKTVEQWLRGITGNKDNPRGSRRIPPLDNSYEPDKALAEMYSMPNGEQEQDPEGEASGGERGEWHSDGEEDEESDEPSDEEVVDSPPRRERRSKHTHDPASIRGKVAAQTGAATSETSAHKNEDEEMEDAVTSNPARPTVIDLPDDDEDAEASGKEKQQGVSCAQPSASTAQTPADPSSLFTAHHVPEDQVGAAKEAIRQAGIMMEQMKVVREASQPAYDASSALQSNVQKSCELGAQTMNLALAQKDPDLTAAQKAAEEKTALADQKLASVGKLEEENAKLKTTLDEANKEATRLKKDKRALTDKIEDIARKRDDLENYLGGLAKKLFIMLEEFCQNFEEETGRVETSLDPILSLVKDEAAMNVAVSRIDTALWTGVTLQNDLESLMSRLNEIPGRV
nr:nucleolin-like [Aegilops tauschii subsp. strangulata]